jgi:predicted small integral membrane protein
VVLPHLAAEYKGIEKYWHQAQIQASFDEVTMAYGRGQNLNYLSFQIQFSIVDGGWWMWRARGFRGLGMIHSSPAHVTATAATLGDWEK